MRVKELIEKLKKCDEDAYVQIRNDKRFSEDVYSVVEVEYLDHSNVVGISSLQGHRFGEEIDD